MSADQMYYQVKVVVGPEGDIRLAGFCSTDLKEILNCTSPTISVPFEQDEPHPDILEWIEKVKTNGSINVGDPVIRLHEMTTVVWEILT
jgi:hypothetical protein